MSHDDEEDNISAMAIACTNPLDYTQPNMKEHEMATRKTRIVCISDTHNQTPKLPAGDILIHAGDLTNQGSYSEVKKTVDWLEKTDFEAKIVVAGMFTYARRSILLDSQTHSNSGNHEIPLDADFYYSTGINKFKWPTPQDPDACRRLLLDSPSITYLENSSATIYLTSPSGPRTCLEVFGSPSSPGQRGWAFQYWDDDNAARLWSKIPEDADLVVTHTPARGHVDRATKDEGSGCVKLKERLGVVRPMMHVCGHIHEGRGVERVKWSQSPPSAVESVEYWTDPGAGNKKISLLDLTSRRGRGLENTSRALTRHVLPVALKERIVDQATDGQSEGPQSLEAFALDDNEADGALWRRKAGGALERTGGLAGDGGCGEVDADMLAAYGKVETAMINAAFLGARIVGKAMEFNKPVVVDIDLPVWRFPDAE